MFVTGRAGSVESRLASLLRWSAGPRRQPRHPPERTTRCRSASSSPPAPRPCRRRCSRPWPSRSSTTARRASPRSSTQVVAGMKYIYQTENDIIVYAACGHRRHGGGGRQPREPRRPRPGRVRRQLRRALEEAERHVGRRGHRARLRVGHQGRPGRHREGARRRPGDQGRLRAAQRDVHRRRQRHRGDRRDRREDAGRSSSSTPSAASAPATSRPTRGRWTSAWPARRRRSWCRRASPTRPSARRPGRWSSSARRRASTSTSSPCARR